MDNTNTQWDNIRCRRKIHIAQSGWIGGISSYSYLFIRSTQAIESRTLALAHSLSQQLQTTCLVLVTSLQGLPSHIQQEALSLSRSATQLYTNFSKANALEDLPDNLLTSARVNLGKMKDSLDNVMDYLVNNTPLNWLVGPFYPRIPEPTRTLGSAASSTQVRSSSSPSSQPHWGARGRLDGVTIFPAALVIHYSVTS